MTEETFLYIFMYISLALKLLIPIAIVIGVIIFLVKRTKKKGYKEASEMSTADLSRMDPNYKGDDKIVSQQYTENGMITTFESGARVITTREEAISKDTAIKAPLREANHSHTILEQSKKEFNEKDLL